MLLLLLFFASAGAITDPADTAALRAFFNAIRDPTNRLDNWQGDDPCAAIPWEGVICETNANGVSYVTELRLYNYNLTGTLAPELGDLKNLQSLNLMWNRITGSIPSSLGNLNQTLELLLLNGNQLSGTLPEELGSLAVMKRLQIDENFIEGHIPPTFGNLTSVKHLHLNNNSLSGSIPPELGKLPQLIHLLADSNQLTGDLAPEIGDISTLMTLQLDNNPFQFPTIPASYMKVAALVKLSLTSCNLQGELPDISSLTNLQYIDLSGNGLTGTVPATLPQNLTVFAASGNSLTGNISESIFQLMNLEALVLRGNRLNGTLDPEPQQGFPPRTVGDELIMDLQDNSFSSIGTRLERSPDGLDIWLNGNPDICNNRRYKLATFCERKEALSSVDQPVQANPGICQPEACNPGVDELVPGLAVEETCRCAAPITVVYRLKSPNFDIFKRYEDRLLKYLSSQLFLAPEQLAIASFQWEGRRLRVTLKLFPDVLTVPSSRKFNQAEVSRLYYAFSRFKIQDDPFFGPFELLSFDSGTSHNTDVKQRGLTKLVVVMIVVILVVGCFALILAAVLILWRRSYRGMKRRRTGLEGFNVAGVRSFACKEMLEATDSFSTAMMVGVGGYGNVYQGLLEDGTQVAIKRAKEDSLQGSHEFQTEIELLSRIHHVNLVTLVGYCCDESEQMLVYEFMAGGTLRQRLSGKGVLDFSARLKLALGSAKGILYLHTEADPPIIHRDIKASNILLDDRNVAKVADFGLCKLAPALPIDGSAPGHVSTVVKGTPGYLDPEYFLTHKLTDKSDVYSFGVVLLELVTGMHAIHHGKNLVREVLQVYNSGNVLSIVDPNMGPYSSESLEPLVNLAVTCCSDSIAGRPSMAEVTRALENISSLLPDSFPSNNGITGRAYLPKAYEDDSSDMYMKIQPR